MKDHILTDVLTPLVSGGVILWLLSPRGVGTEVRTVLETWEKIHYPQLTSDQYALSGLQDPEPLIHGILPLALVCTLPATRHPASVGLFDRKLFLPPSCQLLLGHFCGSAPKQGGSKTEVLGTQTRSSWDSRRP